MKKNFRENLHFFPLLALLIAIIYYGRFLGNFFAFDDFKYLENMYEGPQAVLLGYGALRLVSNLAWWPLFQLSGFEPLGYNLFALLLFTTNGILLYFLLLRLLADRQIAFLAGTIFMLGSAGADAVFWKATNSSLLSLFFCLHALIHFVKYRQNGVRRNYLFAIGFYFLAMFSKEEAASLPLLVLAMDLFFFNGWQDLRGLFKRVVPFGGVVVFYVLMNSVVFNLLLHSKAEPEKLFRLRPLYSLVGGGTAFYLSPDGFIRLSDPLVYLTPLGLLFGLFFVKNRKLYLFGCLWVFLAFLPQSFTGLGQFEPRVIVNSISRYLYITSIGSSLVIAALLVGFRERFSHRVFVALSVIFLLLFGTLHCRRVWERGEVWQLTAEPMARFVSALKEVVPSFPANTKVHVIDGPSGRAFIQQALRAFYGNPTISWVDDPNNANLKEGESLFVILHNFGPGPAVQVMRLR